MQTGFPFFRSKSSTRGTNSVGAFTLIELMVSLTILLLTVLIFSEAIGGISSAWRGAEERMNNHNKARALLGRLRTDIDSMVLRPDLAAFPETTGDFGFYTLRRGVDATGQTPGDARALSFVNYTFDPSASARLLRRDLGYTFANSDDLPFGDALPEGTVPDPAMKPDRGTAPPESTLSEVALADGVLGFEWAFLREDGFFSPTLDYVDRGQAKTAKGLVVAMLVMDDRALLGLERAKGRQAIDDLRRDLDIQPATDGQTDWDPKSEWNDLLGLFPGASGSVAREYPSQYIRGVRAFERMYLFPNTN